MRGLERRGSLAIDCKLRGLELPEGGAGDDGNVCQSLGVFCCVDTSEGDFGAGSAVGEQGQRKDC